VYARNVHVDDKLAVQSLSQKRENINVFIPWALYSRDAMLKAPERMAFECVPLYLSFVRWQMSRLVSDYVPVCPRRWLSAGPDCLPSVTELFRSPLLGSGIVCLILSFPHFPKLFWLKTHLFNISHFPNCDCTV